jgi:hypothetical protein
MTRYLHICIMSAILTAGCGADRSSAAPEEHLAATAAVLRNCRDCGDGWYCDGNRRVHMVADWWNWWGCHQEGEAEQCPHFCQGNACKQDDVCK